MSTMSTSFAPSIGSTISDLDGFLVNIDYGYSAMQPQSFPEDADDFSFDPAPERSTYAVKMEQTCSHPLVISALIQSREENPRFSTPPPELDRMVAQSIPTANVAISRYGQVTPPRSDSESSIEKPVEQEPTRKRRATRPSLKEEPAQSLPATRKRRNTRKNSTATTGLPEEDEKRKQSLEKNRLAASKCRINKKEKTEQLQRNSHDNAVQNAILKEQVICMKEEVQQINALLLAHANCEGCKSPEDIQKHHSNLGNNFFAQRIQDLIHEFPGFANMSFDHLDVEHDRYFLPTADPSLMNPPLPEFNTEPEFDVSTPMQTG